MRTRIIAGLVAMTATLAAVSFAGAVGEKYITYGADTTQAERQELNAIFGADASTTPQVVTTPEMVAALQGTGLPAAPTDKSVSSSVLTCLNRGDGLTVRTQNITRITAPVYANALVTAGIGDGNVIIAAPAANPVTGETALVGVLKAFPQCQAGKQPDQARINLAYEQIARTVQLAGPSGDLNKASAVMLQAAQAVITGQAQDDAAVGAALDSAARAQGIDVPAAQRSALVGFLRRLSGVDYGAYAKGYQVQQVSQNEVRIVPAGAGAPGNAAATPNARAASPSANAATAPAGAPVANAVTGDTFTGKVQNTGPTLTVRDGDRDRAVQGAANAVVTRDGKSATLGDIKKGDKVTVATGPGGAAQRIDATSASGGAGWLKWLIPLLLALAVLGGLLWFLGRRRKPDDFIIEPNARVGAGQDRSSGPRV